ncbi:MAG: nuclear transport factor 2 family protein [Gemmatimonadota bacterium]
MRTYRHAALIALLVVAPVTAGAQARTTPAGRSLVGYTQAWTAHDVERIAAYFTEDAVYEDVTLGEVHRGRAAIRTFVRGTFTALPGFAMAQRSLQQGDGWATLEWVMSGTDSATQRRFSVRGVSVMELEGGRVRRNSDYWNMADLQGQVGPPRTRPASRPPTRPEQPTRAIPAPQPRAP